MIFYARHTKITMVCAKHRVGTNVRALFMKQI